MGTPGAITNQWPAGSLMPVFLSAQLIRLIKDFDNDSLRKIKTDKADSVKIARYTLDKWHKLKQYGLMDELRSQLKTMNRQFGYYTKLKTAMKNNLISFLEQTSPGANTFFNSPARSDGSQKRVDFVDTYLHVDRIRSLSLSAFTEHYQRDGAAARVITSSLINLSKYIIQFVTSFRFFQKMK